jgi:hypothetical protein
MSEAMAARVCAECGKPLGVFAFTLINRVGKPQRGYWHRACFVKAKRANEAAHAQPTAKAAPR